MVDPPLLTVDALNVSIGATAIVESISFDIQSSECLGVVGASGSGKSMTALAVMQLLPAGARLQGSVRLRGRELVGRTDAQLRAVRGRDVGMVFQEPMTALNPLMRVGAQVAETVRLHRRVSTIEAIELARSTLDAVGLDSVPGAFARFPHELSGGQRQRVAIAIAIVLQPALLIADEPTTALDATSQAQILMLLRCLARDNRMGLLLISHDMAVIERTADRVLVMQGGSIVESGCARGMRATFSAPYSQALLAAAELEPRRIARSEPTAAAAVVLEALHIVREYPEVRSGFWRATTQRRAVDDVSLRVAAGEMVGLIGESGSGKSTLLRALLALEPLQGGAVRVAGEPFSKTTASQQRRLRRAIQAVFQDPYGSFDPTWRVERLIAEPFYLLDSVPGAAERRSRVAMALDQVGLTATDAARYPHEFSGGQRQRIAIARALIIVPAVIVFDEAVSALDVLVRAQILELLADLSQRLGLAYLFVSHDLNVVRAISDRVYVMQGGRIVEEGSAERVFATPQHPYTQALIAATAREW